MLIDVTLESDTRENTITVSQIFGIFYWGGQNDDIIFDEQVFELYRLSATPMPIVSNWISVRCRSPCLLPRTCNINFQRFSSQTLSFAAFSPGHSFTPLYQEKHATGIPFCEGRACVSRPPICRPAPPPPPWTPPPPPWTPPPPWLLNPTAPALDFSPAAASGVVLSSTSGLCSLLCVFLLLLSSLMTCLGIPRDLVVTSFVLLLSFILPLTDLYLLLDSYLQPYRLSCHVLQFRYLCLFQHPTSSNNANDPVNLTGSGRTRSVSATPSARLGALATFAVGTPAVMSCPRRRRRSTRRSTTTIIWTPSTSTSLGLTWTWRMRWEPCL